MWLWVAWLLREPYVMNIKGLSFWNAYGLAMGLGLKRPEGLADLT